MPTKVYSGGHSRSVHHNNMINRRGVCVQGFQKAAINAARMPMKFKKSTMAHKNKTPMTMEDIIIKARPPKTMKYVEMRYTIPDCPMNANIITQEFIRTHAKMAVLMNEMKTMMKCHNFNHDETHDIHVM